MYLPPDLFPKGDLMTPRILRMDILVFLIYIWYTRSSCLSVFLQLTISLGLFLLKTHKFDVFTPRFGPKGDLIDAQNPGDGYFCIANTCMVHAEQLLISIFTIQNLSGTLFPKQLEFLAHKLDSTTPRILWMLIFIMLIHV